MQCQRRGTTKKDYKQRHEGGTFLRCRLARRLAVLDSSTASNSSRRACPPAIIMHSAGYRTDTRSGGC